MNSGFGQALDSLALARARRGDMDAHALIYQRFGGACYNLALRVLGEPAAAEDIVQDVFLKMFDRVRGFRGEAPFGAWLKRLVVNAALDVLRTQKRFGSDDAEALLDAIPSATVEAHDLLDIWPLLMQLPARVRAIVVLHEVEGYTHRELSEMFGYSESYSKSILARALKRLNECAVSSGVNEVLRNE